MPGGVGVAAGAVGMAGSVMQLGVGKCTGKIRIVLLSRWHQGYPRGAMRDHDWLFTHARQPQAGRQQQRELLISGD